MAKKRAADRVYEFILGEIVNGRFAPGTPIIEQEIADLEHISRTPVREAIRRLEKEQLLVNVPYQGTLVATLSADDIREICDLRMMIELWALKKSFYLITEKDLDLAEKRFNEAIDPFSPEKYHEADRYLHNLIIDRARSARLSDILNSLEVQLMRFRVATNAHSRGFRKSYEEHLEIIRNIRDKEYDKCAFNLQNHLLSVMEGFVAAWKEMKYSSRD